MKQHPCTGPLHSPPPVLVRPPLPPPDEYRPTAFLVLGARLDMMKKRWWNRIEWVQTTMFCWNVADGCARNWSRMFGCFKHLKASRCYSQSTCRQTGGNWKSQNNFVSLRLLNELNQLGHKTNGVHPCLVDERWTAERFQIDNLSSVGVSSAETKMIMTTTMMMVMGTHELIALRHSTKCSNSLILPSTTHSLSSTSRDWKFGWVRRANRNFNLTNLKPEL